MASLVVVDDEIVSMHRCDDDDADCRQLHTFAVEVRQTRLACANVSDFLLASSSEEKSQDWPVSIILRKRGFRVLISAG